MTARQGATVDLFIVGGGPIGLVTALEAARVGLTVEVAEPRTTPVDKACGEGLMPTARRRLRLLGVEPEGHPFYGICYVGPDGRQAAAEFPGDPGLGVRRLLLHDALSRAASEAGIVRRDRAARVVAVRPTHVELSVAGDPVRARYVAAADGLHSTVRSDLGLNRSPRGPARYGLRQHWAVPPWSRYVEVHWSSQAELYVTPVSKTMVGIAVLTAVRGRSYASWLEEFPAVRRRLIGAQPVSEVRGAGPLEQRTVSRTAGRVLLVGDAAGYVDAITGEGFAVGMTAAEALVGAVSADDPQRYEREWRARTRASRMLTLGLLRASQTPPVRRQLVPAAHRFPTVFGRVVAALA